MSDCTYICKSNRREERKVDFTLETLIESSSQEKNHFMVAKEKKKCVYCGELEMRVFKILVAWSIIKKIIFYGKTKRSNLVITLHKT